MGRTRTQVVHATVVATALAFGLALAQPEHSAAQASAYPPPEFQATAGKPLTGFGIVSDSKCRNIRNVVLRFGDGTTGAPDSVTAEGEAVRVVGSHTYATAGDKLGSVDLDATCTNNLGQDYEAHVDGVPGGYPLGFIVHVAAGEVTALSCPVATTALSIRPAARASQVVCPIPGYVPVDYKTVADKLADAYLRGAYQNKGIADAIDKLLDTGSSLKNLALDKAVDMAEIPYTWVLSVPRWAEYVDLAKVLVLRRIANDPPDLRYAELAGAPVLPVPRLRARAGLRADVARRANAILADQGADAGLHFALLTAIERAGGAHGQADFAAERRQLRHASGLALQLVGVLERERRGLTAAQRALARAPANLRLTRAAVKRAQLAGVTPGTRRSLVKLGLSEADVQAAAKQGAAASSAKLAGRIPAVLGLVREAFLLGQEVKALRAFAAKYAGAA